MATEISLRRRDPAALALLEFQSPSAAILTMPTPRSARGVVWVISTMFIALLGALWFIEVDRVVTATGRIVAQQATILVQPLETAIVRSINVREGQRVRAGDLLARLDSTFAGADLSALTQQVANLEAEVARLEAESAGLPFQHADAEPVWRLQSTIFRQRQAERGFRLENFDQRINALHATVSRATSDMAAYRERLSVAQMVESMRQQLEQQQVGSRLNRLSALDNRLEIARGLASAQETANMSRRELAALTAERSAFAESWQAQLSQTLAERLQTLSDAREALAKAQLRERLVEMRAEQDAIVLTIARVSVGSVLQSGEQFITLIPNDAPLEVEANVVGRDIGFVRTGDPVALKFDSFPFAIYGKADGAVRVISPDSFTAADPQSPRNGSAVPLPRNSTEPFFRVRVTLDRIDLRNVPEGFIPTPGMPMTVDIKVGARSVIDYLVGRFLAVGQEAMREP
jgi:hemolysin D